jgi:hypothetical protein
VLRADEALLHALTEALTGTCGRLKLGQLGPAAAAAASSFAGRASAGTGTGGTAVRHKAFGHLPGLERRQQQQHGTVLGSTNSVEPQQQQQQGQVGHQMTQVIQSEQQGLINQDVVTGVISRDKATSQAEQKGNEAQQQQQQQQQHERGSQPLVLTGAGPSTAGSHQQQLQQTYVLLPVSMWQHMQHVEQLQQQQQQEGHALQRSAEPAAAAAATRTSWGGAGSIRGSPTPADGMAAFAAAGPAAAAAAAAAGATSFGGPVLGSQQQQQQCGMFQAQPGLWPPAAPVDVGSPSAGALEQRQPR